MSEQVKCPSCEGTGFTSDGKDEVITEMNEQLRSGTWSTIRYARRVDIPRVIVYPDGSIVKEN